MIPQKIYAHNLLKADTLRSQVKVKGVSDLDELHFPELKCQPGFSGFFQLSDTLP